MSRKFFTKDVKRGVYNGHFEPPGGWQPGRNGIRRTLCKISDISHLPSMDQEAKLVQMYHDMQAKIWNADRIAEIKEQQKQKDIKQLYVRAAARLWLDEIEQLKSSKTKEAYSKTIKHYLKSVPDHPLKQFDRKNSVTFLTYLANKAEYRGKPLAKNTQDYHVRQLQVFINWAYEQKILKDPIKLLRPKREKKDMETFTVEHLTILKNHITQRLETEQRPREILNLVNMQRAYLMAISSLLRISAIRSMRLDWIDLDARLIRVRDNPDVDFVNKKQKQPNKPINDALFAFLQTDMANRDQKEVYFLDNGKGQQWYADKSGPSQYASKICKECGLPTLKPFHWGMRATMITWLLNNGVNIHEVQQLADHESIQTTMLYFNSRTVQQQNAVNALPNI